MCYRDLAGTLLALLLTVAPVSGLAQNASAPGPATAVQNGPPSLANPAWRSGEAGATSNADSAIVTGMHEAEPAQLPVVPPSGRPVIGLALEGSGALGLAHIGVLQWMEEHHVPVDRIAGTSMGALIGGFYASGMTPEQMQQLAESEAFLNVFTISVPYADISFRRRQDRRELPESLKVGLKGGPSLRNSLVADTGLNELLMKTLFAYDHWKLNFDALPVPFWCVATDLTTLRPVVFDGGPMPQALRASIAMPGVFAPVE